MNTLGRYAFSIGGALLLLVGCSSTLPQAQDDMSPPNGALAKLTHHKRFDFTGKAQSFRVPAGVKSFAVDAVGAAAEVDACYGIPAGDGGRVDAVIPVTQGERLKVYVGGAGPSHGTAGGFNGGGQGGDLGSSGTGGGGASDIRISPGRLKDRILVAGGGGGQGGGSFVSLYSGCGGGGGGLVGLNGQSGAEGTCSGFAGRGADGGSQTAGGAGGAGGESSTNCPVSCQYPGQQGDNGAAGAGGNGGAIDNAGGGGGGGGGYFGGGGGGSTCAGASSYYDLQGGGGGGGSSYAEPSATKVRYWQNWRRAHGNGHVIFSW
jgi:Glycine rich protein